MGLVLIAGLCVSAVTFTPKLRSCHDRHPKLQALPLPTASNSTATTPSGSPSPETSTRTTTPTNAKLPKGPGTTQAGILLIASPLPDGSFDVAEIVLLSTPTSSVRLGPPRLGQAGSRFSRAKPVASQVQVTAGDQPVRVPDSRIAQRVDLPLNTPARRIELRYRLSGITVRSAPSQAGRALTAISPLVLGVPTTFDVAMQVRGSTVHNIACPMIRVCASRRAQPAAHPIFASSETCHGVVP